MRRYTRKFQINIAFALALLGCREGTGPAQADVLRLAVTAGDAAPLIFVDLDRGGVITPAAALPHIVLTAAAGDSSVLHAVMLDQFADRSLFSIALASGDVIQKYPLADAVAAGSLAGTVVSGNLALGVSPTGDRAVLADAANGDATGATVLELDSNAVGRFIGPFFVAPDGIRWLGPSVVFPDGVVLLAGTRSAGQALKQEYVWMLDPHTYAALDSLPVGAPTTASRGDFGRLMAAPNQSVAYAFGGSVLLRIDLARHQVAQADIGGPVTDVVPDRSATGERLLAARAGAKSALLALDANLRPLDSLDLSRTIVDGAPLQPRSLLREPRTGRFFVLAGTPRYANLPAIFHRRVIVELDSGAQTVLRTTALGDWMNGQGRLYSW